MKLYDSFDCCIFESSANTVREALLEAISSAVSLNGILLKNADLTGITLRSLDLENAWFENVCFDYGNIIETNLTNAAFIDCRLQGVNFIHTNIENTEFVRCNWSYADFYETDPSKAHFYNEF